MRLFHSSRSIAAIAGLAMAAAVVVPASAGSGETPLVYAHRGGAAEAPENTLGAFARAWDLYGDDGVWLELDLWLAADGELVVHHDTTLDRTTDCTGPVTARTSTELSACDASGAFGGWGSFEPVPSLRSVLEAGLAAGTVDGVVDPAKVWRLMPEVKGIPGDPGFDISGRAPARALRDLLVDIAYPLDAVQVQSFWPPSLDAVRRALGAAGLEVRTALLTTASLPGLPAGVGFTAGSNVAFSTLRGYDIVAPDHRSLDLAPLTASTVVGLAHAAGRAVVPWTADDPLRIAALADAGVDGLITNAPAAAYCALGVSAHC